MKILHRHLMLATALATGLAIAVPLSTAPAQAGPGTSSTDPGFDPATGQINRGFDPKVPSSSQSRAIPSQEEARAALLDRQSNANLPSIGDGKIDEIPAAATMRQETKDAQSTAGGPQATNAGTDVARNGSQGSTNNDNNSASGAPSQKPQAATTGSRASDASQPADMNKPAGAASSQSALAQEAAAPGPIGATVQTMPAELSSRNDILDRMPIMAMPLSLSEKDRQRIYQAVMADKSQPVAGAEKLAPADFLSTEQALNETHALPASLQDMPLLQGLHYVKAKDKVLLITPSTRIVMDAITS